MFKEKIPVAEYKQLKSTFHPDNFDADFITDMALDAGMTRELVVPDQTGILVETKDLGRLGAMLANLLDDEERRRHLGTSARAHVRTLLLDPPARMDQEVEILLEVIRESERKVQA